MRREKKAKETGLLKSHYREREGERERERERETERQRETGRERVNR